MIGTWISAGGVLCWRKGKKGAMITTSQVYRDLLEPVDGAHYHPKKFFGNVPNTPENFAAAMQWLEKR